MTDYPVKRFIRMTHTDVDGEIPAYAPNEAMDPLEAYSAFLHESQEEAQASLDEDIASHAADFEPEDEGDVDDYYDGDNIYACTIEADGRIVTDFIELTRERVYKAYGVTDPAAVPKP